VLIVEDDPSIAAALARGLTRAGYQAAAESTGAAAARAARRDQPEVVLLDLGLPDVDGLDLCRELQLAGTPGIIVITARGEEPERVAALDAGADDYLVKPFGYAELQARIRAVLRRVGRSRAEPVRWGPLAVDLRAHRVSVDGAPVALTPKEFAILECLIRDPGRVVSRAELLTSGWDAHWYGPTKVIDVHVVSLRRKLGVPGLIETVYGVGFRLADPPPVVQ
jgi:DNA-binding response OmpR family regulator